MLAFKFCSFGAIKVLGLAGLFISSLFISNLCQASVAGLQVQVNDANTGLPLEDVVVSVYLQTSGKPQNPVDTPAVISQVDQQFDPQLLVIPTGSAVSFPNRDHTRHHVYSFSNAKTFEIRLYYGLPAEPIVFDKPGPVVLGCNIHDQMRAVIYVTDADNWQRTDISGRAVLDIPQHAPVTLEFWHPRLRGDAVTQVLEGRIAEPMTVSLDIRPALPQFRTPESGLQQRFDQLAK